jgi:hypothetical protein
LGAFDFLIVVFLNIGNFFRKSHSMPDDRFDPEFYTFPVDFISQHHDKSRDLLQMRAFKKEAQPFIEPIVFLSQPNAKYLLSGVAANNVRLRDQDPSQGEGTERPGIMGAIRRRECPGLKQFGFSPVNRPTIRALARAMEQAGIRPSQNARRVGDFVLERLVFDSPTGAYQDWIAKHAAIESTVR